MKKTKTNSKTNKTKIYITNTYKCLLIYCKFTITLKLKVIIIYDVC